MPFPAHEYMKYKIAKVKGGGSCLSCIAVPFAHLSSSLSHTHLRLVLYLLPNFFCGPGARFFKVPIINGPVKLPLFTRNIEV